MNGKSKYFGTNFKKMDATPGMPDEESPEVTQAMLDRGTVRVGGVIVRGPRKPGRPAGSGSKESIHIMVDKDILAYYRSTGAGWQTRMNAALRMSLPKRVVAKKPMPAAKPHPAPRIGSMR